MRNVKMTICVVAAVVLVVTGVSKADLEGYTSGDSQVLSINFTTHDSVNLGPSGARGFRSLDLMPNNNDLYVTNNVGVVYQVDTASGIANEIVDTGNSGLDNISFDASGQLFAVGSSVGGLANIDLNTGVLTTINSSPWIYTSVTAFAINSANIALAWDSGAQWLFEVDLSDGTTTSIGLLPGTFEAFDFGPDGTLYTMESSSSTLVHVYGITYGSLLDINSYSRSSYLGEFHSESGIAVVPEPTTLLLLGLGGILIRRRR